MSDRKKQPQQSQPSRERAKKIAHTSPVAITKMKHVDMPRLVRESEIQIELKPQNEQLRHLQIELAESLDRYSNLYDFAPIDRDGDRTQVQQPVPIRVIAGQPRNLQPQDHPHSTQSHFRRHAFKAGAAARS